MFTSQKIAAVSGLVTSLAAICLGAPYAYADDGDCATTAQGDTVCIRKSETHIDKDDAHIVKQAQECSTADQPHVVDWQDHMLDGGSASVGPVVDCSNTTTLPAKFKKPHIEF
ncbi:hypothetical protein ABZT02_13460 [Streptomyces sp. NPDC005402]|uniref:hypothetical protein n=1 Tax=Streptomyces sp. NPDC005402 TaxID=3155338 RepID=UPI0033B12E9E